MSVVFCLIILILNIVLWIICFNRIRKAFSIKGAVSEIKEEINKMIIEIDKETDRDITLIESKCRQIHEIIELADSKMTSYNDFITMKLSENRIQEKALIKTKKTPEIMDKAIQNYKAQIPLFTQNAGVTMNQKNNEIQVTQEVKKSEDNKLHDKSSDKRIQVIQLSHAGFDEELIAKKLNMSISEVQTIINLSVLN